MKNTLKINHENSTIVMDREFAKKSALVGSKEYNTLQMARRDYPEYAVIRREIKKNPNKESYRGLTYEYMENYIKSHYPAKIHEFEELRIRAKCHSIRYANIKKWFLETFPEIDDFSGESVNHESKTLVNKSADYPIISGEKDAA